MNFVPHRKRSHDTSVGIATGYGLGGRGSIFESGTIFFSSPQGENPCGGGVEYLHRHPASRRRRRIGKSQFRDSKIRSQVPMD
jgi:hypothetical protein